MTLKAALFDVDGTILNGNCTRIYLDYLFENNLVSRKNFILFDRKSKSHAEFGNDYLEIIEDALKLLAELTREDFLKHWKSCFDKRIKSN